jgi:predicted RNA methylase
LDSLICQLRHDIDLIESNHALCEQGHFGERANLIDSIEFSVIDRIDALLLAHGEWPDMRALRRRAEAVRRQMAEANGRLLHELRARIRSGRYARFELGREFVDLAGGGSGETKDRDEPGYDSLDALITGLLLVDDAPEPTRELEPEMVFYQPTPARIVLELVHRMAFTPQDVFYDIGSGLGYVCILMHLLSGVRARGVEFDPAYCDYARRCAGDLNVSDVEFLNVDARVADYSQGTVFFMYTPFEGRMLQQVLDRLKAASRTTRIKLCTYGPCTLHVSRQAWLRPEGQNDDQIFRLAVFTST